MRQQVIEHNAPTEVERLAVTTPSGASKRLPARSGRCCRCTRTEVVGT
jgi:hypothetical protein